LTIEGHDWSRFVQAVDKFALEHQLVDDHWANTELRQTYFSYTGKEADLTFIRKATAADAPSIAIDVEILEIAQGGGERLKAAFENEVIHAGRFGN
jgi:hypothetical protein